MNATWSKQREPDLDFPARHHPYEGGATDEVQYYDFRKNPELISEVLEDYRPWGKYDAIQTFYELLRWLNGDESLMETSDCAFRFYNQREPKTASGRLMIHLRNVELNLLNGTSGALLRSFIQQLQKTDVNFTDGLFELYRFPVMFTDAFDSVRIPESLLVLKESSVTCIEFEAFGRTLEETMANLRRLFEGLLEASQKVNEWLPRIDGYSIFAATNHNLLAALLENKPKGGES